MSPRLQEGLLREAFRIFNDHGAGQRECVVYFTGPRDRANIMDEVIHPVHFARRDHYEIDGSWLTTTWLDLARRNREIRMQAHTHGCEAFHSETDDGFPIVQTKGFLSLVIPSFGTGPVGFDDAFLVQLGDDGQWTEVDASRYLEWS